MAPPDTPSVETLVHIYARSGASDDANYRAHADACLDFQPITRLRLSEQDAGMFEDNVEPDARDELPRKQVVSGGITLRDQFDDSVFDDDTQKTRSLDSRASSGPVQRQPCFEFPSSAPKSSARVEISLLSSAENSQSQDCPPFPAPAPALLNPTPLEDSIPFGTPPSTVPDSQPALTPAWDVERNNSPGTGRIRLLQVQGSQLLSSQELQSPAKRPRLSVDFPPSPGVASATATLPTSSVSLPVQGGDLPVLDSPGSAPPPTISTLLSRLPMEVHPERPQPSTTAEFTTHITPTLRMLAERMKLGRLFKPAHQARPLRTLERGYWHLLLPVTANAAQDSLNVKGKSTAGEPHPWPITLFDRFWKYLSTLIGEEGRAGWGIWCICEEDPGSTPNFNDNTAPNSVDICLTVRIYTWGEIAAHIYLLLYLASERKIKRLPGVEWRDGKEEPVIRMP